MCGIAGFSGDFDAELLDRMSAAIAHRGPDDDGTYLDIEHRLGLAHRRLSIVDLSSRGRQPMWDATGSVAISFNGEIYNFRELRRDLESRGYTFKSDSDTEVLLNLYLHEGEAMLEKINGIFAFALWDTRDQALLLARDGLGVKPLYYAETPRGTVFASELKAVLQEQSVDRTLDAGAVRDHLLYLWSPSPDTMFSRVKKLPPGHAALVRNGRVVREWCHYELPYGQEISDISAAEAIESVRDALTLAVERQLIADVPMGAFLSGGLDSSSIVSIASRKGENLPCFTIGFRGPEARVEGMAEDLPFARKVAKHLGVDLHTIWVGSEMVEDLPRMIYSLDEPSADPAPINALYITRLAREHGIKVLLSGTGSDDIFTGYRRHQALMFERWWSWLPKAARRRISQVGHGLRPTNELRRRIAKATRYADLERDERLESYFQWTPWSELETVLSDPLRSQLEEEVPSCIQRALSGLPPGIDPLNRMLYLEGKFFLADHNLNYLDKVAMANGVEVRVPFLDRDLVSLASRLPPRFKQHGRTGKWVLKKAMQTDLPSTVIDRPKVGFGAPLRHWLRHDLRPLMSEVLSEKSLRERGLFDPTGVRRLIELNATRQLDASYSIFSMICIELWCRMFLDRPTPEPI